MSAPVLSIRLPGRESRAKEPFFENMQQIVDEFVGTLLPLLKEKPFALFGHRYSWTPSCIFMEVNFYPISNKGNIL